jgi:hypothetical protein
MSELICCHVRETRIHASGISDTRRTYLDTSRVVAISKYLHRHQPDVCNLSTSSNPVCFLHRSARPSETPSGAMPAATASGADTSKGTAKSREHNQGNQDRKYTLEQKTAVLRVRRCQPTAFYEILGLEEVMATVTESEIKKAYRKLSLLTHPD